MEFATYHITSEQNGNGTCFFADCGHCTNINLLGALVNSCSAVKYRQIEERAAEVTIGND